MIDDDAGDHERRQLGLMDERLVQFRNGSIPISRAISDLEGLLWALEGTVPQAWFDEFLEHWGALEVAYAVALDRLTAIPDATDADVRGATDAMLRLVGERQEGLGIGPEA